MGIPKSVEVNGGISVVEEESSDISPLVSDVDYDDDEEYLSSDVVEYEESDSSEDEVPSRHTIGDIPLEWYKDDNHLGYDAKGKKIKREAKNDKLDILLANAEDSKNLRKLCSDYNDEEVELMSKDDTKLLPMILKEADPYAIYVDPNSLLPKLPSRKDLKPYPSICYLEYKGHKGPVSSISIEVSGSNDGTVRVWEVETGRCLRIWDVGEPVHYVAWNPKPNRKILAVSLRHNVLVLNTGFGTEEEEEKVKELLHINRNSDESTSPTVDWNQYDKYKGLILKHPKSVSSVEWHFKGDYFSTVMPSGNSKAVLVHQLSKKLTQSFARKLRGIPVCSVFHPSRHIFFVATKKTVCVYDLLKNKRLKKLEPGLREISSIAIHPSGDHVVVGSHQGKVCWFEMERKKPSKKLNFHAKEITGIAFHRSYPLFAACSEDSSAYVFHGMLYSDLNQDPLIVPLKILHGHKSTNGRGVLDCVFHPRQPWLFTAGSDSVIKLYCNH